MDDAFVLHYTLCNELTFICVPLPCFIQSVEILHTSLISRTYRLGSTLPCSKNKFIGQKKNKTNNHTAVPGEKTQLFDEVFVIPVGLIVIALF